MGSIYALVALGFTLLINSVNIVNLAQGEFVMLGGFLIYTLVTLWGWPFWLSFPVVIVGAGIFGLLFERLGYRPLKDTGVVTIIVGTLGLSVFMKNMAVNIWGALPLPFSEPFGRRMLVLGGENGLRLVPQHLLILGLTAALVIGLHYFFRFTRIGVMMRAAAQDQVAARLMGVPFYRLTALTFALAAALGALAGVLLAPTFFITAEMGTMVGIKAFVATIVGGWGSIPGAIAGGLTVGLIEALSAAYLSSKYKDVFAFLILIVFLLFRPQGILGEKTTERA